MANISVNATIIEIVDASTTYVSSCNVCKQTYDVGIKIKLENGRERTVPIVDTFGYVTKKLPEIKKVLNEKYNIKPGRQFTFELPYEHKDLDRTVETTKIAHGAPGNVDNAIVFTSRTVFNNRVRKALTGNSHKLKEYMIL